MTTSDDPHHRPGTVECFLYHDLNIWKRIKKSKSQEGTSKDPRNRSSGSSSQSSTFQLVPTSFQERQSHGRSEGSWAKRVLLRPLITVLHSPALSTSDDSGYASLEVSPVENGTECPSIPRFSWQSCITLPVDPLRIKPRHVEIVIPAWAQPIKKSPDLPIAIRIRIPDFPLPPPVPSKAAPSIKITPPLPPLSIPTFAPPRNTNLETTTPSRQRIRQMKMIEVPPNGQSHRGTVGYLSHSGSRPPISRADSYASSQDSPSAVLEPSVAGVTSANSSFADSPTAGLNSAANSAASNLSGLACNVHRTTGIEPPALVGASTTIVGDKLYVFGGRRLSRRIPQLTRNIYALDLVRRHWTKLSTRGSAPIPRYFHSMCALGDSKLVCYGGMAGLPDSANPSQRNNGNTEATMTVMPDIHIYDIASATWTAIPTSPDAPPGRYAHCAAILPSSGVFTSATAPLSAIQHNPSSTTPNKGSIGVQVDGTGGAEMVVIGGQDGASRYIEQISVFNLRSLRWTTSTPLARSCGAYRSVAVPLLGMPASLLGAASECGASEESDDEDADESSSGAAMLIYSNYNFLDVKLELQIRLRSGKLVETTMQGSHSPPGLRFPNGGVLANHLVVSGTFLTSTKQEYALWALDLRSLTWSRVDAGVFGSGSWNRGVLWAKRNAYIVLGNRRRNLGEDYNHRRTNFAHLCVVELEAFGLYENPTRGLLAVSLSQPASKKLSHKLQPTAAQSLGQLTQNMQAFADMDILALDGTRIPANTQLLTRRWGAYFVQLLRESEGDDRRDSGSETSTLRPSITSGGASRNSSITITPSVRSGRYSGSTAAGSTGPRSADGDTSQSTPSQQPGSRAPSSVTNPTRSRLLYLPHTAPTIHALLYYLYTTSLPAPLTPLCTPQILCSLLQIARPYRIAGLLEATVERLHQVLDGRNTAAVFNAAAMAAGSGEAVGFLSAEEGWGGRTGGGWTWAPRSGERRAGGGGKSGGFIGLGGARGGGAGDRAAGMGEVAAAAYEDETSSDEGGFSSASASSTSLSSSEFEESDGAGSGGGMGGVGGGGGEDGGQGRIWSGSWSKVVGLQKRGLRGLMEGRKIRERERGAAGGGGGNGNGNGNGTGSGGGKGEGESSMFAGMGG